jgi:ribosomal protein S18 acetylase RimI-like enzyme
MPGDLDALHELDQICFRLGIAYSKEELTAMVAHQSCVSVMAEDENKILAGFAIGQYGDRQTYRHASIVSIDVSPDYRRRGLGRQLMQWMEGRLRERGAQSVRLEVAVDDPEAIGFYRHLGYRATRRIQNYYMNSLDAFVMEKYLPPR